MRLRVLSDLHLEFMGDRWSEFVEGLPNDYVDVLVLAGDIAGAGIDDALEAFCQRFPDVVFVAGNHEYYSSSVDATLERIGDAAVRFQNLHWLEPTAAGYGALAATSIKGQRFLGGTLWFQDLPPRGMYDPDPRAGMTDFHVIRGFEPWVYRQNQATRELLAANVRPGDVVVTHHLPSHVCVHQKYRGSPLNRFFLGTTTMELDQLIERAEPAVWCHGHSHSSVRTTHYSTRIVCNPYGYAGHELNPEFDPALTVEI